MRLLADRRLVLLAAGGVVAVLAGLGGAALLTRGKSDDAPPPASTGGLVVDATPADEGLDAKRPLRCFVAGKFVGEMTLLDCAQRNGIGAGALDVGVDETGALAAADQAGMVLTPLPPQPVEVIRPVQPAATSAPAPAAAPLGPCWRYASSGWRMVQEQMTQAACVQALFAGRCERPGGATYGRWAVQTLRLVPGRVEVSSDDRTFRTLVEQGAGCALAPSPNG